MTMRHESQHTVPQVFERHWRSLLHDTAVSEYVFAAEVRSQYERLVPSSARSIEWSQHDDLVTRMKRDAEKLNRWFRDDVHARFPAEAVEAFVLAFPPDRRFVLQQELATRQGLLVFPAITGGASADTDNLGRIAKETGEAIVALSGMLEDNVINERDSKLAPRVISEIDQAVATLIEMRERVSLQALRSKGTNNKQ